MHHSDRDMVRKSQEGHIFQHCWQYNPRKKILKKDVSIVLQVGSSVSPLSLLSVSAKIKFYKLTWGGKGREDCRNTSNMGRSNITFPKWSPQHGQRMLNPDVCTAGSKIFLQRARERTLSGLEMEQRSPQTHSRVWPAVGPEHTEHHSVRQSRPAQPWGLPRSQCLG